MKKRARPTYNSIGLLPEKQLQLLADARACGFVWPDQLDSLSDDETLMIDCGLLSPKNSRGMTCLRITPAGLKVAPSESRLKAMCERFLELAPWCCGMISDNIGATLKEHKIDAAQSPITELLVSLSNYDQIEEIYAEYGNQYGAATEIARLKADGLI